MTTYCISSNNASSLAILAGTYEIRLVQAVWYTDNPLTFSPIFRYEGATLSGGTVETVVPTRKGAPAASSIARGGVTPSGTAKIIEYVLISPGQTSSVSGSTTITTVTGSSTTYQPPLPLTVAPGSALYIDSLSADVIAMVFFEELRLQGSF